MKEELSISELRKKRTEPTQDASPAESASDPETQITSVAEENIWARTQPRKRPVAGYQPAPVSASEDEEPLSLPFDPFRLLDALKRNLAWCILAGILGGLAGISWFYLGAKSMVTVQLARQELPTFFRASSEEGESFRLPRYTDQALVNIMQSPEMVRRVSDKLNPPWLPEKLARSLLIYPERENELVTIQFNGRADAQTAADVVNLYAMETLERTKELQAAAAKSFRDFVSGKLQTVSNELILVHHELEKIPAEARAIDTDRQAESLLAQLTDIETRYELARIDLEANNPINDRLLLAREELAELLLRYTEQHPFVIRQQEKIKTLENQLASAKDNTRIGRTIDDLRADNIHMVSSESQRQSLSKQVDSLKSLRESLQSKINGLSQADLGYALLKNRFNALRNISNTLANRQREAELFLSHPPGYFTVLAPASVERVNTMNHIKKTLIFTVFGALFGFFSVAGLVAVREVMDDRIRTKADLERASGLPVIGSLGNLEKMDAAAQRAWAFRTWTIIKGKLTESQTHGLVCGVISAHHDEGRSTWIKLLTSSANERGLRVLTISTKPTQEGSIHPHEVPSEQENNENHQGDALMKTFESNVLSSPAQVAKHLKDPSNAFPVVHIPLPGWVWNLERRKQWQNALGQWEQIDKLVLLVELPPASEPESVLLAEKLPHLLWLSDSGKTTLKETRHHLETLRHAGCNLVGAVLNREPESFWRNQVSRWFGFIAAALLTFAGGSLQAQSTPQPTETIRSAPYSFSATRDHRAPWQQRLTLGPGDILNLGFFGETNLLKTEVPIGPDGRLSYLQATDVMAAGLTVDELREALDKELSRYYRAPRTMVTPVAFNSKKYYVLGKVMRRGVFTLDQPITVLEAVARAEGLEAGMYNRNTVEMADLSRSFLVREGQRIPINFEKLFYEGDLSQNIAIHPDDYLYFPAANLKEVYVVGEVGAPGVVVHTANTTLMRALADRGGFNDRAFRSRVLVVRGSLNRPETFVIDVNAILDGRAPDFKLEAKDVVFVNQRPFIRAEELLDLAATAFIQGAVTSWTGANVGPVITSPIF
ncbi:MAG: polysaccharide biosynthesis/export family protein [Limisphaerales bacterium]